MARKQIVVCDRCGLSRRLGTETERFKRLTFGSLEPFGSSKSTTDKELCGSCVDDILDVINKPPH